MFRRMLAVEPGGCAAVRSLQSVAMRQLLCMNPVQPHIQRLLLKRSRVRATQTIAYVHIMTLFKRFLKAGCTYSIKPGSSTARRTNIRPYIYKPLFVYRRYDRRAAVTADSTVKALLLRVACDHLVSGRILKTANPMAIVELSRRTNFGMVREYRFI